MLSVEVITISSVTLIDNNLNNNLYNKINTITELLKKKVHYFIKLKDMLSSTKQ